MVVYDFKWKIDLDEFNHSPFDDIKKLQQCDLLKITYLGDSFILGMNIVSLSMISNSLYAKMGNEIAISFEKYVLNTEVGKEISKETIEIIKRHMKEKQPYSVTPLNGYINQIVDENYSNHPYHYPNENKPITDNYIRFVDKVIRYKDKDWVATYKFTHKSDNTYNHLIIVLDANDIDHRISIQINSDTNYVKKLDLIIKELIEELLNDFWTIDKFKQWDGNLDEM